MNESFISFEWHIKKQDPLSCSVHGYNPNPELTGCYVKITTDEVKIYPSAVFHMTEQQLINLKNNLISECERYMAKYRGE